MNEQANPEFWDDRKTFCEGLASTVNRQKVYAGVRIPMGPFINPFRFKLEKKRRRGNTDALE